MDRVTTATATRDSEPIIPTTTPNPTMIPADGAGVEMEQQHSEKDKEEVLAGEPEKMDITTNSIDNSPAATGGESEISTCKHGHGQEQHTEKAANVGEGSKGEDCQDHNDNASSSSNNNNNNVQLAILTLGLCLCILIVSLDTIILGLSFHSFTI